MRNFFLYLFFLLILSFHATAQYMIVGTYDSPKSEGVYVFVFDQKEGTAREVSHIKTSNPSFVAISPNGNYVYAVHEVAPQDGKGGDIAAFTFNKQNGTLTLINKQLSGGDHPCHVEVDKTGKWLFVSNYSSGSLSVLPIRPDGSLGEAQTIQHHGTGADPQRQKGPHTHGAIIDNDNKLLFVTDLGIDQVLRYSFNWVTGELRSSPPSAKSDPGSGPRLFTFHPSNRFAYVVEELSGTVVAYKYTLGDLKRIQRISTVMPGDTGSAASADIHLSPDGKFLYASNRGNMNNIAIYRVHPQKGTLTLVGHQSTLGKSPRNFSIDPTGQFLLAENQNSDEIVIFKRDQQTGLLSDTGNRIAVGKPVCIKWMPSSPKPSR